MVIWKMQVCFGPRLMAPTKDRVILTCFGTKSSHVLKSNNHMA